MKPCKHCLTNLMWPLSSNSSHILASVKGCNCIVCMTNDLYSLIVCLVNVSFCEKGNVVQVSIVMQMSRHLYTSLYKGQFMQLQALPSGKNYWQSFTMIPIMVVCMYKSLQGGAVQPITVMAGSGVYYGSHYSFQVS